jgi:hypothetical protein
MADQRVQTIVEGAREEIERATTRRDLDEVRVKYLGTHSLSSTVVCCQLLDPRWKLEVEAMAAT